MNAKRQYKRNLKKSRKKLQRIARGFRPWDYYTMLALLRAIFEGWRDYYELGYNVHAMERSDPRSWEDAPIPDETIERLKSIPTRATIARTLLEKLDAMEDADILPESEWKEKVIDFFDYLAKYHAYMWD